MVQKIHKKLNGTPLNDWVFRPDFATHLLALIEECGMRPPLREEKDPGHFPGDDFVYTLNDWEHEDET